MPELVTQQTIGGNGQRVERWVIEVQAANALIARQRARVWARAQAPNARNVFSPEVKKEGETVQSTFNDIVPESIERKEHQVELTVVLPQK